MIDHKQFEGHTPGPWRAGKEIDSSKRLVYILIESLAGNVATTGVYGHRPNGDTAGKSYVDTFGAKRHEPIISANEARANAALIAAVPDLLAENKKLREALEACDRAFVAWQVGQIPGRPEDILALISQVRAALNTDAEVTHK